MTDGRLIRKHLRGSGRAGLKCGSSACRLLGLSVRIPPGARTSVSWQCCVLSSTGLCVGLITRPEETYRNCGVSECDRESSTMRGPWPTGGCWAMEEKKRSWRNGRSVFSFACRTENNHKNPWSGSRCVNIDSSWAPTECQLESLPLH
jgi:hypothetical protein